MFDLIYSIIKYTKPNSIERNTFIDNINRYYSKQDMFKTSKQLSNKDYIIKELRNYTIRTKNDVSKLRKMIEEIEK